MTEMDLLDEFEDLNVPAVDVATVPAIPAAPPERRMPSDVEIQLAVEKIAKGLRVQVRSTVGEVTDTFIVGGDYAPGRARWVQTKAYDSADKQAAELAASLQ